MPVRLALGIVGFIMGLAGYDGMAEVQTSSANTAIIFLYNILPMILFVVMFIISLNYKVDDIRPQMDADLKAKHEGAEK